ncbi:hypothetical protein AAG906_039926 [Vitis piasezkii]
METMALCESRNKENIPPFSSKQTHPVLGITPSSTKTFRRRFRKPLADITNLFNSSPQSASASASHSGSHLPHLYQFVHQIPEREKQLEILIQCNVHFSRH